jgi:hypothetical protein
MQQPTSAYKRWFGHRLEPFISHLCCETLLLLLLLLAVPAPAAAFVAQRCSDLYAV